MIKQRVLALLLIVVAITAVTPLSAQQYKEDYVVNDKPDRSKSPKIKMIYGLMVGVNIPIMREKESLVDSNNSVGFMGGLRWGVDFGGLEIVPEIWYMHDAMDLTNESGATGNLRTNSIEMPIIIGIDLLKDRLRFNFGPSFSLMSNAEFNTDYDSTDLGRFKSTAGYLVGFSYTALKHWVVDVRYSGRFVSSETYWPGNEDHYDYRYYNVSVTAGYRF